MAVDKVGLLSMAGGGIGGMLSAYGQAEQARRQNEIMQAALSGVRPELMQGYDQAMSYQQPYADIGQGAMNQYTNLLQNMNPDQYGASDLGEFSYGKTVQDFYAPQAQFEQEEAMRGILGQAATSGLARSGGALKEMQDRGQGLAAQRYENARGAMMNDKTQAYNQFLQRAQFAQQNAVQRLNAMQTKLSGLGNVSSMGMQASGNLSNLASDRSQSLANLMMTGAQSNANAVSPGWAGYLGAGLQGMGQLGSFFAGSNQNPNGGQ